MMIRGLHMKKLGLFSLFIVLVGFSCSTPRATVAEAVNTSGYDFVILHYNDFHARNTPWVPARSNKEGLEVGGAAYLDAMMDSVEALFPHALRFHAGDDFQGTPFLSLDSKCVKVFYF